MRKTPDNIRCTARVPDALSGALNGPDRPVCHRVQRHDGKHRAQLVKRGVGKTSWEWKDEVDPPVRIPPEVTFDGFGARISSPVVTTSGPRGMRVGEIYQASACECRGVTHVCAPFRGLVR